MAELFFCEGLFHDQGTHLGTYLQLLQTPVLVLELLHLRHKRNVHTPELGTPLKNRGVADPMLPTQNKNWRAGFGLL